MPSAIQGESSHETENFETTRKKGRKKTKAKENSLEPVSTVARGVGGPAYSAAWYRSAFILSTPYPHMNLSSFPHTYSGYLYVQAKHKNKV